MSTLNPWGPTHLTMAFFIMIGTPADAQQNEKNRGDLLEELARAETDYQSAPGDDRNRRAYADVLFKLGEFWRAHDVIAPLATTSSTNTADLVLGARLAYMTGDYTRAEALFTHVRSVSDEDSEAHGEAADGLIMVYYQTNQYAKASSVTLAVGADRSLLEFMQRFEGTPYHVEWATVERVASLSFSTQDPLPLMTLEINGHPVEFILDTGGGTDSSSMRRPPSGWELMSWRRRGRSTPSRAARTSGVILVAWEASRWVT